MYTMTQKSNQYIKLFSTFSRVRLVSFVSLQLTILCTSLVKPNYTKNDDSPVFTVHTLRLLCVLSYVLDFIELIDSYQNV